MSIIVNDPRLGRLTYPEGTSRESILSDIDRRMGERSRAMIANPELGGMATGYETPESSRQGLAFATRTAMPIAAGIATAPATLPAAMAVGAGSSMLGEYLGQVLDKVDNPEIERSSAAILAAGVGGSFPGLSSGGVAPRLAVNLGANIGTQEIADFIGTGKFKEAPKTVSDTMLRFGLPTVAAGLGSLGGRASQLSEEAVSNRAQAGVGRGINPTITLSEGVPSMTVAEQKAYVRGNQQALNLLGDIRADIGGVIDSAFPYATADNARQTLMDARGRLEGLQSAALKAEQEFQIAQAQADRIMAVNAAGSPAMVAEARLKAFKATVAKLAYGKEVSDLFGGDRLALSDVALGARNSNIRDLAKKADDFVVSIIDSAYDAAGLKRNTRVMSGDSFMEAVNRASKRTSNPLNDASARDALIGRVEALLEKRAPADGLLTLEDWKRLRGEVFKSFELPGQSEASKKALRAASYEVISEAADNYLASSNPSALEPWKTAQGLAAARFSSVQSEIWDLMTDGKSDQIFQRLVSEGKRGDVAAGLKDIEKMIRATYNPAQDGSREIAQEAATLFRKQINETIRDGVLGNAQIVGKGLRGGMEAFDPEKIASTLDTLSARGIAITPLGLGTPKQIRALAKINSMTGVRSVSRDDVNLFLDQVQGLGEDRAAWAVAYRNAVRDELIAGNAPAQAKAASKARQAARNAKIDADAARKLEVDARADPLVDFMAGTNLKLSGDDANNAKWVSRFLAMPEDVIRDGVASLEKSRRFGDLEELRIAAATQVMRQFESVANGSGTKADLKRIGDFFYNQNSDNIAARRQLRALLGDKRYKNLEDNFGRPVMRALETEDLLSSGAGEGSAILQTRLRATGGGQGGLVNRVGAVVGLNSILDMARDGYYSTMYKAYIDPQWSSLVRDASGAIDLAMNKSPSFGTIVGIYRRRDEENRAKRGQPQP